MAKWSDFFSMTRHERTGALVVLALIVVAVVAQWAIPRCSSEETPPLTDEQLSRFQRETDTSLVVERPSTHRHRRDTTRLRVSKPRSSTSSSSKNKNAPSSSQNQRNDVIPNEAD